MLGAYPEKGVLDSAIELSRFLFEGGRGGGGDFER